MDTEVLYFHDSFYDNVFKIDRKNDVYLAKRKGQEPFTFSQESEKFELAITPDNIVTMEFFESY